VEHVLAAVAGTGIDDLEIELDAAEPPIMDGSSAPFVEALLSAGIVEHNGAVKATYLTLRRPLRLVDGESVYEVHPAPDLELQVSIDFPHPVIGLQSGCYRVTRESFVRDLAPARNVWLRERGGGVAREGTHSRRVPWTTRVVLDDTGVIGSALRWPDEFVRHKALDCVGDLCAGRRPRPRSA
jgi:UDP-3-O-acyl-N-acetylglucosamine deacetylase